MKKRILSIFLILGIFLTSYIPSVADSSRRNDELQNLNQMLDQNTSVTFEKVSETEVVYTYMENGKMYRNVDKITSPNTVQTQVYLVDDTADIHLKSFSSIVNNSSITAVSKDKVETYTLETSRSSSKRNWKYRRSFNGNTSFRNQSLTAIAILLSGLIGPPYGAFLGVSAYIYDKNIKTVYYHVKVYKDLNSPKLRPAYKYISYFYQDSSRRKPLPGNPVVSIVEP